MVRRHVERILRFLREHAVHAGRARRRARESFLPSQGDQHSRRSARQRVVHQPARQPPHEPRGIAGGAGRLAPAGAGTWTVVAAKNEGITPGFRIRDAAGREYLLKFDPLSNPELASAADVITSKFFYALGYNVPENYVVYFDREPARDRQRRSVEGRRRTPAARSAQADIDEMLAKAPRGRDGKYRAHGQPAASGQAGGPVPVFRHAQRRSERPGSARASPRPARPAHASPPGSATTIPRR